MKLVEKSLLVLAFTVALSACQRASGPDAEPDTAATPEVPALTNVTGESIAATRPGEWLSVGRTYSEQRFSPLDSIDVSNVGELGLAWYADMDTARGQEATPLFIDGKLYVSTAWSMVKAFDARSGQLLWSYDPGVSRDWAAKACCDVVNRGVAAWGDKLYVGTLDGRLVALDRETGEEIWSTVTVDQSKPYTITGAPRIVKGKVLIGNGGAEFGVRGYLSAYDADTGERLWRFYTVPDNPANGEQPDYLERAADTWSGEWWKLGGGGTVWDSMAYDPDLDLLYIGVGNGSPWNQSIRSPDGGDNLYLSSIVALRPDSGEYVWHYQTTPGDTWDFTATQHIILADLEIRGENRKVLMQAPKNGFFYVIDRETGKLISANNYVPMTWATGVDIETGRPIENPEARYGDTGKPFFGMPGAAGGHNWHPMAFDPNNTLVYIPAIIAGFPYIPDNEFEAKSIGFNTGVDLGSAAIPAIPEVRKQASDATAGALIAWDPVKNEERWRVDYPGPWNSGLLATGGGLVFQGSAAGAFAAFDAASGEKLWSVPAQTGVVAAPMTYELDGEQYVAVLAGWGGIWDLATGILSFDSGVVRNRSRLLVYKLGGDAELPPEEEIKALVLDPPALKADAETVALGAKRYGRFCGVCHGDAAIAGALVPDLRHSGAIENRDTWQTIVHDGALQEQGMISFADVMSEAEIEAIRHYVISRANEDLALERLAAGEESGDSAGN